MNKPTITQNALVGVDKRYNTQLGGITIEEAAELMSANAGQPYNFPPSANEPSPTPSPGEPAAEPEDWNAYEAGFEEGYKNGIEDSAELLRKAEDRLRKTEERLAQSNTVPSGLAGEPGIIYREKIARLEVELESAKNKALKWELEANKWQDQLKIWRDGKKP